MELSEVIEIFLLPLCGIVALECFHTRGNELVLLLIPFLVVGLRLAMIEWHDVFGRHKPSARHEWLAALPKRKP